jgi:hypothetical protein
MKNRHEEVLVINSTGPKETGGAAVIESVADVLDRELKPLIADWLARIEQVPDLTRIPLDYYERTGHLPKLVHDVTARVRLGADAKASVSQSAAQHGESRYRQGYTMEMLIEESRLLQVCIFTTLHKNVKRLNFDLLLPDIVTIADEVDAQLRQQMHCYKVANTLKMAQAS